MSPASPHMEDSHDPSNAAFSILGSDVRLEILQSLSEAEGPLSFTALRETVGPADSGQFNYHLRKLEGLFVLKTVDGYVLRQAGGRIIETIRSGALTDDSGLEPTVTDSPCAFRGAPVAVSYH